MRHTNKIELLLEGLHCAGCSKMRQQQQVKKYRQGILKSRYQHTGYRGGECRQHSRCAGRGEFGKEDRARRCGEEY